MGRPLDRANAFSMVRRRAKGAGLETPIGCRSFRATGITIDPLIGGVFEKTQMMAAHSNPRTIKPYDRRADSITRDEVERIVPR